MRYRIIGLIALTVVAAAAAQGPGLPVKVSADAQAVAQGNNAFACDLYAQLSKKEGNIFFSPYSVSTALGMTYAGAKGKTAQEMAGTLHFDLAQDKMPASFGELIKIMNARGEKRPYQLSVANSLWGAKGYNFLPAFLTTAKENYQAGLKELDFLKQPDESRKEINAWVEKETQNKIKDLLQGGDILPDTRLVLVNAIYFKAAWEHEFWDKGTKPGTFTPSGNAAVQVPMMMKNEAVPYLDGESFQLVKLPYKDKALSMIVLLPKKADGLPALEKSLTAANLKQWLGKATMHQVDLKMPKFKTTTRFDLKQALSDMGMPTAFTPAADFSGISTQEQLMISKVIHKAFVDVHEKGTEAAAATAVIIMPGGLPPQYPNATFHADHPFAYIIYENQTGSILFMGRMANPQS